VEEITGRVESTSRTVQEVANAPAEIVNDIADRVRRAWKRRQAESAEKAAHRAAEHESEKPTEMVASTVAGEVPGSGTEG
jgi:hypothetical protein